MQSPFYEPLTPFHIAVQVRDIAEARRFYKDILGCAEGRSDTCWVDFNLYGHQLVCHLNPELGASGKARGAISIWWTGRVYPCPTAASCCGRVSGTSWRSA